MDNLYIAYFSYSVMEWYENQLWKLSWTQIQDTDSCSDTDSTKHDSDLSNQALHDY